ncbi:RNA polymerase sigma factor [Sphingosinicella sp. LHD-64]|uniref:RNA polymerase sigma factor n=1 Tax=Sphingosinicella sp. LHD-64 TaxID=3072139 RepID=UPI00280EEC7A|nr:RNA polymerase sigma factor [Sphingosinicella sp. LHD-64]MDQ8756231.1 RNA polymerase sigma factor [Sphingosinicella sp. LHD-64]
MKRLATPRAEAEEQASIEALSQTFRASLGRYFSRRVRDPVEAEDMVQEVFERLLKRGNIANLEHAGGYVFETASSVLADRFRKRRSHHADAHDLFDEHRHGDVDFSPEHVLLGREKLARATAILLELPERTRVIFVLRRLEGMRYSDIAARLGISVSAVEKHMQRAIAHLAKRLEE